MRLLLALFCLLTLQLAHAQDFTKPETTEIYQPVPPKVATPPLRWTPAPADAIVLFDGKSLEHWQTHDGGVPGWVVRRRDSTATVVPGSGDIFTKQKFGSCQLHLEFRLPLGDTSEWGNSGVFLQRRYEVQIFDSYSNTKLYSNGQCASVYKQHIPLVNACKRPGEWQSYDIFFTAPKFRYNGSVESPARVTVLHNGLLVQNSVEIQGTIKYIGVPQYEVHSDESLQLQNHGAEVSFRNIWIRKI